MKALRFPLSLALGLSLSLFAGSVLAQDVDLNTITAVQVNGGTIEITGSKKPNFTTFTMTDPPRLVIDISEAVFSGVAEEQQVNNGSVTAIKTASYGSDESAIARVLIGFERDVETDIQSSGNKLVVKVLGAGGAAVAQAPPQPAAEEQPPAAEAEQPAPQEQPVASTEITPEDQPDPAAVREAERRAEQERQDQERLAREAAQRAEEERLAQEREARENAERAEQERVAAAERAAQEREQREAEQRKQDQAEQEKLAQANREREEAAARARQEQQDREAERRAQLDEQQRQAEQERLARAERERLAEQERQREQERIAMAEQPPAREEDSPGGSLSVSSRRKTISLVGFKQEPTVSRVFVRTNEPVSYRVRNEGNNTLVLELENTRIGAENNARFLDTSYFDTAVAMVDPKAGPTRTVEIEIKLKENVPYEAKQQGNEVVLEFPRPSR